MTFKYLLWRCAGANIELLEECPNDHSRYQNIGATIIMTAILAWISMGFALFSVFNSTLASILIGFVWACMIFILDRTIVTSMQKPIKNKIQAQGVTLWGNPDNRWSIFRENFREMAFVAIRIIIAILISLVITKPLEIKIFESRLRPVLDEMKDEQASKDSASIWNSGEIVVIKQDKLQIEQNIENLNKIITNNEKYPDYDQLTNEAEACFNNIQSAISSKNGEIGNYKAKIGQLREAWEEPRPQYIEQKIEAYQNSYKSLETQISTLQKPCNTIIQKREEAQRDYINGLKKAVGEKNKALTQKGLDIEEQNKKASAESSKREEHRTGAFKDNIIPQIQALEKLKADDTAMRWTSRLIMFMFIIIEIAPVLAKLLSKRGQYDDAFEEAEISKWIDLQEQKAAKIKKMNENIEEMDEAAKRNKVANATADENAMADKLQLEADKRHEASIRELANYTELVHEIAEAQKEIALKQVELWKKEQLEKLNKQSNNNQPAL